MKGIGSPVLIDLALKPESVLLQPGVADEEVSQKLVRFSFTYIELR